MLDIVYVSGPGRDEELKYSLRTLEYYGSNYGRIIIVGYIPNWLGEKENLITLRYEDVPYNGCKQVLINECIDYAVKNVPDLTDHFLYSSIDHFLKENVDFNNYPLFCRCKPLRSSVIEYDQLLRNTETVLLDHNYSTIHFAMHRNTHFFKQLWLSDLVQALIKVRYEFEPSVLMGNMFLKHAVMNNYDGIVIPLLVTRDVKLENGNLTTFHDMIANNKTYQFMSSSEEMFQYIKKIIDDLQIPKSSFEK